MKSSPNSADTINLANQDELIYSVRMRASTKSGRHISGAEGLYNQAEAVLSAQQYADRALCHERGRPDKVLITIEPITEEPLRISTLPLCTVDNKNFGKKTGKKTETAKVVAAKILSALGISKRAVDAAFDILRQSEGLRGAAILDPEGVRLDSDLRRGVRVSRMGISSEAVKKLSIALGQQRINTSTVREALLLSSKVNHHLEIIGEICISDDPGYTTGYVASSRFGYIRIPRIKKEGLGQGGRVFFLKSEDNDIANIISYLEKLPVIVSSVAKCQGLCRLDDIFAGCLKP